MRRWFWVDCDVAKQGELSAELPCEEGWSEKEFSKPTHFSKVLGMPVKGHEVEILALLKKLKFDAIEQVGGLTSELQNKKYIKELENERGLVLNNAESITEEILLYFEKLYASPTGESWSVEGLDWSPISEKSALRLDFPFTEEEISKAIFSWIGTRLRGLMALLLQYSKTVGM
ncbi:hypothetical protein CK203_082431 [Vitis vinifera]|uniref:Uncharacterized protein n=1 Tax=Vitis vinifera TaxID=29760 RepID=A0A438BNF4_VITVI|nr:hypothetical protein CK203_082431 [Vitis vinifera]